jgi:hypothetical protein
MRPRSQAVADGVTTPVHRPVKFHASVGLLPSSTRVGLHGEGRPPTAFETGSGRGTERRTSVVAFVGGGVTTRPASTYSRWQPDARIGRPVRQTTE